MIDSVDMLWDRSIIMKNGKILANVTKQELDESKETLEDMFFRLTESKKEESSYEKGENV